MTTTKKRVVVLADSDTRWKWGASVARQIAPEHKLDAYFLRARSTPTERQLAEVGIQPDTQREVIAAELVDDEELAAADILVFATAGGTTLALAHSLGQSWDGRAHRPITVTGYVGVVYEKMVDGLLTRAGIDVLIANSAFDANRFRTVFRGVDIDPDTVVEAALPFLGGKPYNPPAAHSADRPFTLCFAVQPSVPKGRSARIRLLERAAAHARRHPDRLVLFKLRSMPGEHTTHVEAHPYQVLIEELAEPAPENLQLVYGNMGEVLDHTDLLVTVSSTAALESLHRSIPTAILTDFGLREVHGNHYFVNSGCLASWDDLDNGIVPTPDPEWTAAQGIGKTDPYAAVRARLAQLRADGPLPTLRTFHTPLRSSFYLPELLTRHGLDEKGRPLPVPLGSDRDGLSGAISRPLRRAVRRSAKGLYRVGHQRVAPMIRRWGQI